MTVFERAMRYIDQMPGAVSGQGGHSTTFAVARALAHGFGLGEDEVFSLLKDYNRKCSPMWTDSELRHKSRQAVNTRDAKGRPRGFLLNQGTKGTEGTVAASPSPDPVWEERRKAQRHPWDRSATERVLRRDLPLRMPEWVQWLAERSPVDVGLCQSPGAFLERLYEPGEVVLCFERFESQGQKVFWAGHGWYDVGESRAERSRPGHGPVGGEKGVWFLAQPVSGKWMPNPRKTGPDGAPTWSRRLAECVTSWRFLVLENDWDPREPNKAPETAVFLNVLVQLGLPIAAIYSTGGRGIHALVRVDLDSKARWDTMRGYVLPVLAALGADPGAITGVRLSRLPGCWRREPGNLQRLLYFAPDAGRDGDHRPMVEMGRVR
jgi:hypothetical protein